MPEDDEGRPGKSGPQMSNRNQRIIVDGPYINPTHDDLGNPIKRICTGCGAGCDSHIRMFHGLCDGCIDYAHHLNVIARTRPIPGFRGPPHPYKAGGQFILDNAGNPEPIWGSGNEVLWPEGESLEIVGPQGTGKSTIAQQLALARTGVTDHDSLLGYPVSMSPGRVLYLAMDRPRQIARSFARMVTEEQREQLDNWLFIWPGPPLEDLAKNTDLLTRMAEEAQATTIVVDSLKDAAIGLNDDDVGAGWNRARQKALHAGCELLELHHQRKAPQGTTKREPSIDDVYGSTWITSGAGSVLLLTGTPGDSIIGAHHVKQPAEPVGPLKLIHDHAAGRTSIWHSVDLIALATRPEGVTAIQAARALFDTDKPTPNQKENARRRLNKLTANGAIQMVDPGDKATNTPARWSSAHVISLIGDAG